MGLITDALRLVVPESKLAAGATMPTWTQGVPQYQQRGVPYMRAALDGYSTNEVVYACVEELCTSAAEPQIVAYRGHGKDAEQVDDHPALDLLEHPNPFTDRFQFIAGIMLYLALAGNAYVEKVRSRADDVVELWLLRPDRVRVIPDRDRFISGYHYEVGDFKTDLDARDVIHLKARHPFDDYYGLPPLAACAQRVDTANLMRSFTAAFFRNAGVPMGLLTLQKAVTESERNMLRTRWRGESGGTNAWSMMVLDDTEATYTPMGMPLGERGLVMPDLDDIDTAHIASVFGVPLEMIGARLSMRGQRSAAKEARAGFWDETLAPQYIMLGSALSAGLVDEYDDIDRIGFDLATVKALQEDQDAKHLRMREDMLAGLITREEAREALGYDPEPSLDSTWVLGRGLTEVPPGTVGAAPQPPQAETPAELSAAETAAQAVQAGKVFRPVYVTPADVVRAKEWVRQLDVPVLEEALNGKRNGHRRR